MLERFSISSLLVSRAGEGFLDGFRLRSFGKGALICGDDQAETGVFIVTSGRLRVYLAGEEREITLFHLGPGEIFCMHSGCLVEALDPVEIRLADIGVFEEKLARNPDLALGLLAVFGRAMVSMMRTIEDLMFYDVRGRLARFLVSRAASVDRRAAEVRLELDLTVEQLANAIGSSRQATSSALSFFTRTGLVERVGRGTFLLKNVDGLRGLSMSEREGDAIDRPR